MSWYAYCLTEQRNLTNGTRTRRPFVLDGIQGVNGATVLSYPSGEFAVIVSEFDRTAPEPAVSTAEDKVEIPERSVALRAPFTASVWQVAAPPGSRVAKGDKLISLEAMKMETILTAPHDGTVTGVYVAVGAQVTAGQVVAAVLPDEDAAKDRAGR